MSSRRSRTGVATPQAGGELCVFVRAAQHVLAFPARFVERLALASEVQLQKSGAPPGVKGGEPLELALSNGLAYAAWDLGAMLEVTPQATSWVLLRLPFRGRELALGLRTGACLIVQTLPRTVRLPEGMFRARASALTSGFPVRAVKGRHDALVGLKVDPLLLWTTKELDASAAALAGHPGADPAALQKGAPAPGFHAASPVAAPPAGGPRGGRGT
jgi:hypothetical protein